MTPIEDSAAPIRDATGNVVGVVMVFQDASERRRYEATLRENEGRHRAILESITDAFYALDRDWRFTYVNVKAEALMGRSREALLGRDVWDIYSDAVGSDFYVAYHRAMDERVVVSFEAFYRPHDRWYELHAYPSEGGISVYFRDIGERERAEAELRASEKRVRLAFDSAELGSWHVDPATMELTTDERFRAIFGIEAGRIDYEQAVALIHADDQERVREAVAAATRRDDPAAYAVEYRVAYRDGSSRWVSAKGRSNFEGEGAARRLVSFDGTLMDITARRRAEEERQLLASIAENSSDFIGCYDAEGYPIFLNRAGRELVGLGADHDIRRTKIADYCAPEQRGFVEGVVLPAVVKDGRWSGELTFRHFETQAAFPVLYDIFRVDHPEPGQPINFATVTRDITERNRAEEELRAAKEEAEDANRAKDDFLAVLSHELRTPLNPILLATTAMIDRPTPPEEFHATLEMIRQNVNLQARLIDDLLDVMRIVRGKMPLHWGVSDCHDLIGRAVEITRSDALGKNHHLILGLNAEDHCVNADARLQQVFWNLLKNAIKFTPEGGAITVRTRNDGESILIEVADTGIGIDPKILPEVFDAFHQGDARITRKFGGLGLGLAICRGVVEAHGGTIAAESDGRDRGTTFRIVLKTMPVPEDVPDCGDEDDGNNGSAPAISLNRLTILAVDDEPTTLRLMARLLGGLGHRIVTAGTVADAWEAFGQADGFDLIISDIGLPDGSGLDLMRKVKAVRSVPAIALTGYGMDEDIRRCREAGFTTHMTKPIDFTKLEAMIRQVAN